MLRCAEFSEPVDPEIENPTVDDLREAEELLPSYWTFATYCPFFHPERRELKTRNAYKWIMRDCGIPLSDETKGVLAKIRLK